MEYGHREHPNVRPNDVARTTRLMGLGLGRRSYPSWVQVVRLTPDARRSAGRLSDAKGSKHGDRPVAEAAAVVTDSRGFGESRATRSVDTVCWPRILRQG